MPIIFPANPTDGQTFVVNQRAWKFDAPIGVWSIVTEFAPAVAGAVEYDNETSGLIAENVQAAIDEVAVDVDGRLSASDLIALESNLIPQTTDFYDLGSETHKWKDLYLSGDTIYLGDVILKETESGLGIFQADGETPSTIEIAEGSIIDNLLSDGEGQIKDKISDAEGRLDTVESDISGAEGRLDIIEGNDETSGSIAKALKDAKDYTDIAQLGFGNNYAVADITERDNLTDLVIGDLVFVDDTGDSKWAQFKVTNDDPITFLKIMDQDVLTNAIDGPGIKAAYESNEDTNAFTDALLTKLDELDTDEFARTVFFAGEDTPVLLGSESENTVWNLVNSGPYEGSYSAVVTVNGILSTDVPIVDLDLKDVPFDDWGDIENDWSTIKIVEASDDDEITFYASEEPVKDLSFVVKVVR